ncbi:phosphoadenylyl-sulfate reductase [bacterium]|nr:phosphoadenylyl-sulfate reductase [bacterium]
MNKEIYKEVEELNKKFEQSTPVEFLSFFLENYKGKIALASSLGIEDQVLTHMVISIQKDAEIFTLDTGRLFPETYDLIDRTSKKYKNKIKIYSPRMEGVQEMVNEKGINLFFDSIENRKLCCNTRKIEPLKRAFKNLDVWICGLRAEQSVTRADIKLVEWDANNGLIKINPLANWSEEKTWAYIKTNKVPYNTLHDKGYPSIGCQPCTREVMAGEDIRAGRWWWENPDTKECGLHK